MVEAAHSPLTEAVIECLYGLHSPRKPQPADPPPVKGLMTEEEMAEDDLLGEYEENPSGSLNIDGDSLTGSILDDIMDGEDGEFCADIEIVSLIPPEFWGTRDQPKSLEGDVFAEEAECASLTEPEGPVTEWMLFEKLTADITKHLKPLYIKSLLNGKLFHGVLMSENK